MNVAVDGLVNTPNGQGETPLHWSTKNGHDAVSRILIEQRADVLALIELPHTEQIQGSKRPSMDSAAAWNQRAQQRAS